MRPRRGSQRGHWVRLFVSVALALVLADAEQRGLVALGVLHLGGPYGESRFSWTGFGSGAALLVCGPLFVVGSLVRRVGEALAGTWLAALMPVAGAVYVVTAFFAYDPYYLPTLRRFSDENVPGWWIALVVVVCAVACVAVLRAGRAGLALGGLALWWCIVGISASGWH